MLLSNPLCAQYSTAWLHDPSGAWAVVTLCEQPEYNALYTSTTTRAITLSRMTEVVATREALLAPADHELIEARQVLAWHLWQAGRGAEAKRQLRSRARAVLSTTCDVQCAANGVWLRTRVYLDLGWLLLGMEKHEAAAQLVSQNAAQLPQAGSQLRSAGNDVAVLHAWIRAAAGDHAAASAPLAASVDHDRASSSLFNELQSLIDLAYFAEMAGDEVLATRRRDDLRQRAAELRTARPGLSMDWLRSAKAAPYRWSHVRLDAQLQWLVKYEPTLLAHHRAKVIRIKSH